MAADAQGFDWNVSSPPTSLPLGGSFSPEILSHLKPSEGLDDDKEIVSSLYVPLSEHLRASSEIGDIRLPNRYPGSGVPDEILSGSDNFNNLSGSPTGSVPCSSSELVPSVNSGLDVGNRNCNINVCGGSAIPVSDFGGNISGRSGGPCEPIVANNIIPSWDLFVAEGKKETTKKDTQSPASQSRVRYRGLLFSPSEPSILAEKYIILGPVDASTAFAIHRETHQRFHIKLVTARSSNEVAAQQALLDADVGVRSPLEIINSPCGRQSWFVFPPHYGDLHSYVRLRRRLREAETQRLFAKIAATVSQCHDAGLILRDLKLRKFVFTDPSREEVALESLEDSVLAGESDLLHDKHGCPAYVAPEILTTTSYSGRHADMWGLGVILYTMLIGRYPFHNSDTSALFAKIRNGKYSIPEWVSSRARHLIMGLLRRQPNLRLTAEQVLSHPWLTRPPRDHSSKDIQDHVVPMFPNPNPAPLFNKICPP